MKAKVIGKGGENIKRLQDTYGTKITMPKQDAQRPTDDDDDDATVDVQIVGNTRRAQVTKNDITRMVGERSSNANSRLRNIPAEFYPFIAGPNNDGVHSLEQQLGNLRIDVPNHQSWRGQAPPQPAPQGQVNFLPSAPTNPIILAGDRQAVQEARARIERQAEELRRQLAIKQMDVNRGRHQFIVGDHGMPVSQFLAETGCSLVMPEDSDDETITIIGPADRLDEAGQKLEDIAFSLNSTGFDMAGQYRKQMQNDQARANEHARNVVRYLQRRREIERLEREHEARIYSQIRDGYLHPFELYARDARKNQGVVTELKNIASSYPPSRMANLNVNPFYHQHLQNTLAPRIQENYGVFTVVADDDVILVFEGPESAASDFCVPRAVPSPQEIQSFQRGLEEARKFIEDLVNQQQEIKTMTVDVPKKFHERLRKFIIAEKEAQGPDKIAVRVIVQGTTVNLQGPASSVEDLAKKVADFVVQETADEKERGHTTSFPFQQKLTNFLIGKGGNQIKQLRDQFDVDLKIENGTLTITGPPTKAAAAKTHIQKLEKQWADETTHILKIDPKYHRQIIGAQGAQLKKLENRYKVAIHFPRGARTQKEEQSVAGDSAAAAGPAKPARRQQAEDEVEVKGPSRGADEARDELLSLLQYFKDNSFEATVTVQQSQVPSIIGQGGRALDELRQETGAKVDVPGARDAKDPTARVDIVVRGTKSEVAAAKKALEEKKAVFDDSTAETIEIEKKHHRSLIGPGGSILRQIILDAGGSDDRRELARTVQFPRDGAESNKVKVEGRKAVVEKIVKSMQEIVTENESKVTETIDVPTTQHRHLIGRGGDAKMALQTKFNVNLDIPGRDSGKTGIRISGLPADVEAAKAHVLEVTKEEEGETVAIPVHLHHTVSKEGQLFRQLQRDHGVKVDHAGHRTPKKESKKEAAIDTEDLPLITDENEGPDFRVLAIIPKADEGDIPWVLRGETASIEKAKAQILKALEAAKAATHIGYLTLEDPRLNRYVIGQGGNKVTSIRKQTNCTIEVPKSGDSQSAIEIIGDLENVQKAKDLILKAVEEGARNTVNHSNPRRD